MTIFDRKLKHLPNRAQFLGSQLKVLKELMRTIYLTLLLTSILSPVLVAQNRSVEAIDWKIVASLPPTLNQIKSIGLAGAVSGIHNNALIIAGGTNFPDKMPWLGGAKRYYDNALVYPLISSKKFLMPSGVSYKLPFNLAYAANCTTKEGIVVAGGENELGLSKKVLLLKWKKQQEILSIEYLPDLPYGITNASLAVVGDILYLAGGEIPSGSRNDFIALNLKDTAKGWVHIADLPNAASHTVILGCETTGQVYLIGGRCRKSGEVSQIFNACFAFDIKKNFWKKMSSLPFPISAASGVVNGHDLLVFSGDGGETFNKAEKLIIAIGNESDEQKKEILNKEKIELQSSHPGFSRKVLKYNLLSNKWILLKNEMPYGTVTVNAISFNDEVFIAGGEVKAGVRTPNVLRGKLKFTQ